ncbi:GbsR/MarR family transcriptional regulator [Taibaiella koreensis]|uniref:GbsR/MarR family transcriptional regulator n=1 Tax=Taibaiella koreensis TaxID=1268548 RepID=UPI000E5A0534|nr:helix-turn-helix domain-containing protein [Taibaiella koreensis]
MEQYREKIEEYGHYYEKQGFSPVASRVMGYLFLHPEGEATFEELVQYFGVSKSAISGAIKILSAMEIITEKTKSGARKRYFKVTLERMFAPETVVKKYRETRLILEDIRKLRKKKDEFAENLAYTIAFLKALENEFPRIHAQLKKDKK